jgi:hypothetical protein
VLNAAPGNSLSIVTCASVRPHEIADSAREERIERRLRHDGQLRDPLMVGAVPGLEGYVLLDGTNRLRALNNLALPLVLVQVLDYADPHAVHLRTWCHAASLPIEDLLAVARTLPGIEVVPLAPLGAPDALAESTTLALLLQGNRRFALVRADTAVPRPRQLRLLVDSYEHMMSREDCDPEAVEEHAIRLASAREDPATLVAFPAFTRSQVVDMAMNARTIPAGITRHVIHSGRILRVNVPLDLLAGDDLAAANQRLRAHLQTLQPRMYREPTILYDS